MERKSLEKERGDRHSNMIVHGVKGGPKKGGAGGKGVWGKGGADDLLTVRETEKDPNYNSEDDENEEVVLEKTEVISPIQAILMEYFVSGEIDEAAKSLRELKIENEHHNFVRKSLIFAMEKGAYERELVSQMLSALYSTEITPEKISDGFQTTLENLDEILIDVPEASELVAKFLARAIVDEIIPPSFLKTAYSGSNSAREALALATALTTEKHRIDRLTHVWGPGDLGSVKRLKEETQTIVEEYLVTGDVTEADKCIRKLNAPSFHFQLVKQAVRLALQKTPEQRAQILKLLAFFSQTGLVSADHTKKGFQCVQESMEDIKLDIPSAEKSYAEIVQKAQSEGWLSA